MKTKWVPWAPPTVNTFFDPPLKIKMMLHENVEDVIAYIPDREFPAVTLNDAYSAQGKFAIEVPDEPKRMTKRQVFQLLSRGGWVLRDINRRVTLTPFVNEDNIDGVVDAYVKVARIEKMEWIEPTTDLLN